MQQKIQKKKNGTSITKKHTPNGNMQKMHPYSQGMTPQILSLQSAVGNRGVQALFESDRIQAKLKIGQPNDKYEQEADRVADEVMRMPEPPVQRQNEENKEEETVQTKPIGEQITPLVYRKEKHTEAPAPSIKERFLQRQEDSTSSPSAIKSLNGPLTPEEGAKIITAGETWLGVSYLYGGDSRDGIDCSHFVHRAYQEAGFDYDYLSTSYLSKSQNFVPVGVPQAGDLILFQGHVGIYNPKPPKAGKTVLSAGNTGVHYGKPGWYTKPYTYYRYFKTVATNTESSMQKKAAVTKVSDSINAVDWFHHKAIQEGGIPLSSAERTFFEPRFGTDLSKVRVHASRRSEESAKAVNALAYTVGKDIVFGAEQYRPQTYQGRKLLAHELTHVVQQSKGLVEGGTVKFKHSYSSSAIIQRKGVSFELADAPVPTSEELKAFGLPEDEARVHLWLKNHVNEIAAAETRFRVDRRAIAGAIAWEALENVKTIGVRAVGPGKVHVWDCTPGCFGEKETVAEQVEHSGYLPPVTEKKRRMMLKTSSGAIEYIGAIMSAFAEEAERPHAGGWSGENIRARPEILTNAYQSEDLISWEYHLDAKKAGDELKPGNPMANWVLNHLKFLENAVGRPNLSLLLLPPNLYKVIERSKSRGPHIVLPPEFIESL